jgi:hypothetical protein
MGKEARFLKHVADVTLPWRDKDLLSIVLPGGVAELNETPAWSQQPGNAAQQGGFARSGSAKKDDNTAPR